MRKAIFVTAMLALTAMCAAAQPPQPGGGGGAGKEKEENFLEVSINQMPSDTRDKITRAAEEVQARGGATRGVIGDVLKAVGFSTVSSVIDVATNEIVHLVNYNKEQKKKWRQMIENENNYTDSIASLKGLNDFYKQTSNFDALDPSNINFDGFSIRGRRDGQEVLYLTCHIDTARIAHLFNHSKFYLVVDSIVFNPYMCHLPNLSANGIRLQPGEVTERNNSFSFSERQHLTIGMELTITSSWINEAVFVQRDVELGKFKINVTIPDGTERYVYSRKAIEENRELMRTNPGMMLDTAFVAIDGDCFIVPRSYMPNYGEQKMWGTGEYNVKVKFREVCQFREDATLNAKMKHWKRDYKQLREMQKKGSEVGEYFKTIWNQNGSTFTKTVIKQGLTTLATAAGATASAGAGGGGGAGAAGGAAAGGAAAGGAAAKGQPQQPK